MSDLPGETHAIAVALNVARQYGYGNLISRLQKEWSERLQENSGLSKDAADAGAWKPSWFWGRIDHLESENAKLRDVLAAARKHRDILGSIRHIWNCSLPCSCGAAELDTAIRAVDQETP